MAKILTHRIHGKRQHQQVVAGSLIGKYFMWVIGQHVLQRYHSLFNRMPLSRLIKKNIVPAKQQQWSASLCHSLVPHTYGRLSLRFVQKLPALSKQSSRLK